MARLRDLFDARDPVYKQAAHYVIETNRPSVSTLVNMIIRQLEQIGELPPAPNTGASPQSMNARP
jgi:shikimate kinase